MVISLLKWLTQLVVVLLLWWGVLMLGHPLDWMHMASLAFVGLCAIPPLTGFALIRLVMVVRARRAERQKEDSDAAARAAQEAARNAARERHREALRQRREGVECRWLGVAAVNPKGPERVDDMPAGSFWLLLDSAPEGQGSLCEILTEPVSALLQQMHAEAAGAGWLPFYIQLTGSMAGAEQLGWIQSLRRMHSEGADVMPTRVLPGQGPLGDRVLDILRAEPDLPGLVVLAFDAPGRAAGVDTEDRVDADEHAAASAGSATAVAMLFLRPGLTPADADDLGADALNHDPYAAHWDKAEPGAHLARWGRVPLAQQAGLDALPSLAVLSQAARAHETAHRPLALAGTVNALLDPALVNAGLLDVPFEDEPAQPGSADSLAWVAFNGGPEGACATRTTALFNTFCQRGIEFQDAALGSNSDIEWGAAGAATQALLGALAIGHSARLGAPVLLADFNGGGLDLAVARPVAQAIADTEPTS
jgi:hypothetical protein